MDEFSNPKLIRIFDDLFSDRAVNKPSGLVFIPQSNRFVLPEAASQNASALNAVTPFEETDQAFSVNLPAAISPQNTAYDSVFNRLVALDPSGNRLITVLANSEGRLAPSTPSDTDIKSFGIKNARGVTVDNEGTVYVLDGAAREIVVLRPAQDGSFSTANISRLSLPSQVGSGLKGIAFDPTTNHLHISNAQKQLIELTQTGEFVGRRDLSGLGLNQIDSFVFAPSGDTTDNPTEQSLYLASSDPQSGGIAELSFIAAATVAPQESLQFVRTTETRTVGGQSFEPPSPDTSGITFVDITDKLVVVDGEINEDVGLPFQGVNVWELTTTGSVTDTSDTTYFGGNVEPNGIAYDNVAQRYYYTNDNTDEITVVDGAGGTIGGPILNQFRVDGANIGSEDAEGITHAWIPDGQGGQHEVLFIVDGLNNEVYRLTPSGGYISQFDTEAAGVGDPEGIVYDPVTGHLFVVSSRASLLVMGEFTIDGEHIRNYSLANAPTIRNPAGVTIGPGTQGGRSFYIVDRGVDNNIDPNANDGKIHEFVFDDGAAFGVIGDRIWNDEDGDGVQDASETGLEGVIINLLQGGAVVSTASTDADGNYLFNDLAADTYTVQIDTSTLPAGGVGVVQTFDPDTPSTFDDQSTVTLIAGEINLDQDFGYQLPDLGSIGDRIWFDEDGDGVDDVNENGIPGVTVNLLQDSTTVATTTTDGIGGYLFNDLLAGTYTVEVDDSTLPGGSVQTFDPDTPQAFDDQSTVTLATGENNLIQDFGYNLLATPSTIEVRVSASSDDAEEVLATGDVRRASADLELAIDRGDDQLVGMRFVDINIPQGATITNAYLQFQVDETDTDVANLRIWGEATDNATAYTNVDGSISARPLTSSVIDWSPAAWDTVGEAGLDQQTPNLAAIIQEIAARPGWSEGNSLAIMVGGAPGNTGTRVAESFNGSATAAPLLRVEYLAEPLGLVGDRIWSDEDGDGVQDASETGLAGVTVNLLQGGTVVSTASTDADGNYLFNNLEADTYTIQVDTSTLPAGGAGAVQTFDPDTPSAFDDQSTVTLSASETNLDQDYGYQLPDLGSIGDRIWFDEDGDGVDDANETGLTGVTVNLLQGATTVATAVTDANGGYLFTDLLAGTYTVEVDEATLPGGAVQTFDPDTPQAFDNQSTVTLAAGEDNLDQDFGYDLPAAPSTIQVRVSASSDDAEEDLATGNISLSSSDLEMSFDRGDDQLSGMRFVGINIPQGATITNAYLQFQADETDADVANLRIWGEATDDASTFSNVGGSISARPLTSSVIDWSPVAWGTKGEAGLDQQTPNLAAIIQEIVARPGWGVSNSLAIMVGGAPDNTGTRVAESFDGISAAAPLLHVEFA